VPDTNNTVCPDTADNNQSSRHIPCAVHLESLQILKSGPGGRQRRDDKKGIITAEHATILAKLGFAVGIWCDLVWNFKRYFGRSRGPGSSGSDARGIDFGRA
jgi:hypothetical protein